MEWMVVLNRIVVDLESEGPIRTGYHTFDFCFIILSSWYGKENSYWRCWSSS